MHQNKYDFLIIYMSGFLAGILFANLAVKDYVIMTGIFHEYFLSQYTQIEIIPVEYMLYLFKWRIVPFGIVSLCGLGRWKKAVVVICLLWTGFSGGMLAAASVLRMGAKGMLLCIAGIFPHFIFYILSYTVLLRYFYMVPAAKWNSGKTFFTGGCMFLGIMSEVYINPVLVKMILEKML